MLLGYTLVGLIAFRLLWGVIGTRYARFGQFAFGPRQVIGYVRSLLSPAPRHYVGHNPAGSWAIYLIVVLGILCGITGYAGYAEIGGDWVEELHESIAGGMLAVVAVHIVGVIVSSLLHRENLLRSMINGYKTGPASQGIRRARWPVAIAVFAMVIAFWGGMIPAPGLSDPTQVSQVEHSRDHAREHH